MTTLHIDLLLALKNAGEYGLPLDNLLADLRRGRHRSLSIPQAERALRDLCDKSFASAFETALSGKRWAIAELGALALEKEGL